ncbi:hypothetical protein AYK26_06045 [Euryarchaeota archaeon SM23-78]|nr:MAG: hypothetical protein AYK26_06045 [Euryarchaeota archaeon SM23-78]MBW3000573.1 hypothetical protein [Candidatus Woesearchaeota archaeon]
MSEASFEEMISTTIKELDAAGRIIYEKTTEEDIKYHHEYMRDWGHVIRVIPANIKFTLTIGYIDKQKRVDLYPDKPLTSIIVENEKAVSGNTKDTDPFITNIRMGAFFYRIHIYPESYTRSDKYKSKIRMELHRSEH